MNKHESSIWYLFTEQFTSEWARKQNPVTLLPMRTFLSGLLAVIDRRLEQFDR